MKKTIANLCLILSILFVLVSCQSSPNAKSEHVSLVQNESQNKLDIFIDGKYFTSYMYADTILKKPVLFPLLTASGIRITRGYPLATNPGERMDHPHHYGLWFNHGDVNGVDFWNSGVIPKKPGALYGKIHHVKFLTIESGDAGTLEVTKKWISDAGEHFIDEQTRYTFNGDENTRIITHLTTLTAPNGDVLFQDSKQGTFAMRVRRELEIPSNSPTLLFDKNLQPADSAVVDKKGVTGQYLNSNGLQGYPEVWGKRAKWMRLSGYVENDSISICIFAHPNNINYPPHWMARDYGLYGVNPMGSNIYTNGAEQFNFVLEKGKSVTFKNQVVIFNSTLPTPARIDALYKKFITSN